MQTLTSWMILGILIFLLWKRGRKPASAARRQPEAAAAMRRPAVIEQNVRELIYVKINLAHYKIEIIESSSFQIENVARVSNI